MDEFLNSRIFGIKWSRLLNSCGQTLYMVGWGLLIGTVLGLILALILVLTRKGGVLQGRLARILYLVVNTYVNVIRSVPFVILLVTIMPLTRLIMGTTIGSTAALVPLVLYISPYLARLLENSLLECSPGILEAAQAMGANIWQIIRYFLKLAFFTLFTYYACRIFSTTRQRFGALPLSYKWQVLPAICTGIFSLIFLLLRTKEIFTDKHEHDTEKDLEMLRDG